MWAWRKLFSRGDDQIVGAGFYKNKWFDRNASHADFGVADDDTGLKCGPSVHNVLRDDFQKHLSLFQDE